MLKKVLFASVAVSSLCLGPTFGWPTHFPLPPHGMSLDTPVAEVPRLPTQISSASTTDDKKGRGRIESTGLGGETSAVESIASASTSTSLQPTKKRKVSVDDDGDSEEAIAIVPVAQVENSVNPFQAILMVADLNQLFSEALDLKSYLNLASANKNPHVRKVILDRIMNDDPRRLHHIQWQGGPQAQTFLNYLFNRTVWEAQRDVFRIIFKPTNDRLQAASPLARRIQRLGDPRLKDLSDVKAVFEACYSSFVTGGKASASSQPFIYRSVAGVKGVNLPERNMALFIEHLIPWSRFFSPPSGVGAPAYFKQSYYYDAVAILRGETEPSRHMRSVVERFANSQVSKARLTSPVVTPDSDIHLTKAKIYADLYRDDIVFTPSDMVDFALCINNTTSSIDENLAVSFCDALNSYANEDFTNLGSDSESKLVRACVIIAEKNITKNGKLVKALEVSASMSDKVGDAATTYHLNIASCVQYQLWKLKGTIGNLERSAELEYQRVVKLGDAVTANDLWRAACAQGDLWNLRRTIGNLERYTELQYQRVVKLGDAATAFDLGAASFAQWNLWNLRKTIGNYECFVKLENQILAKLGDAATIDNLSTVVRSQFELWQQRQTIGDLERCVELSDQILTKSGDAVTPEILQDAAYLNRLIWTLDPQRTPYILKAISLVDRRHELLKAKNQLRGLDILLKAWYALQHSHIDPSQTHRREEAKSLWKQATKMGMRSHKFPPQDQVIFDSLNNEFGDS